MLTHWQEPVLSNVNVLVTISNIKKCSIMESKDIWNSQLVLSIREANAYTSLIAEFEENDLLEQQQSDWDPF